MHNILTFFFQHIIGLMPACNKNAVFDAKRIRRLFVMNGIADVYALFRRDIAVCHPLFSHLDFGECKGIVNAEGGKWLHVDYVPEEYEVRYGAADYTGRVCVIGSQLNEHELHHLFGV
jgi:hypothetical protein